MEANETRGGTLRAILMGLGAIALIIVLIIVSAVAVMSSRLIYETELKRTSICTSTSPDGQYSVEVVAYGEPIFFSPEKVGIRAGGWRDAIRTEVANDGGRAHEDNFRFTWNDNVVTIVIDGEEQYPETYEITFQGKKDYSVTKVESAGKDFYD